MPSFTYKARIKGKLQQDTIEAEDEKSAYARLEKRRIKPLSIKIKPSKNPFASSKRGLAGIKFGKQKITQKDLVIFSRTFSTMMSAGLPLIQCLDILGSHAENETFGEIIFSVKKQVEGGENLSDAMKKYPQAFDSFYCNLIESGEVAGALDTIASRLALYLEKAAALRKKVKSAVVYPACILTVAVGVIVFLMIFVIPAFATMFEGGDGLPGPTAIVMAVSDAFRTKWHYMLGTLYGGYFFLNRMYATNRGRIIIDKYSLKLPVVGPLIQKVSIAKFTRTLSTLLSSGVPLIEGLEICARTSGNKTVELAVIQTIEAIKGGENIAGPLARAGVFPPMVTQMIDVGESSGSLDAMLAKIADFYDEEVDAAVGGLTALLEPALMVFLGIVVGFIVIAMYLPIFKMGGNI